MAVFSGLPTIRELPFLAFATSTSNSLPFKICMTLEPACQSAKPIFQISPPPARIARPITTPSASNLSENPAASGPLSPRLSPSFLRA